jgi:hypothetical protein
MYVYICVYMISFTTCIGRCLYLWLFIYMVLNLHMHGTNTLHMHGTNTYLPRTIPMSVAVPVVCVVRIML